MSCTFSGSNVEQRSERVEECREVSAYRGRVAGSGAEITQGYKTPIYFGKMLVTNGGVDLVSKTADLQRGIQEGKCSRGRCLRRSLTMGAWSYELPSVGLPDRSHDSEQPLRDIRLKTPGIGPRSTKSLGKISTEPREQSRHRCAATSDLPS